MEQPSNSKSPLEKLEAYSPTFLDWRNRYNRSLVHVGGRLVCGDPRLDLSFQTSEAHMNRLLENYHAFLGGVAFEEATSGVIIPVEHVEESQLVEVSDGRGAE